ncbi:hypothetical protein Ddye_005447 [Dipteronia dyeriana]|uniref:HAT C-terminal dimerisation domain-containing protein n=1 Tax=Dipteronia dyeriana TaxID=168575 RepID=A0AAE0CPS5_9ROSI|nr:hypothetical protein Ddye_005447 [Dipteronia dyeriana]
MSELLNSFREDEHLGAAVVVMETKLKKYWANIPLLYALSAIIDPRFDAVEDKEEFDLLLWWKTYTYRYPVLSHLARDVLVIPVSTVSSEQAFSTSGHIIEPRRNCLSPEMVDVLTFLRDLEHAKKRLQNLTVDKELNLNFDNLYIDDPSGSDLGQN